RRRRRDDRPVPPAEREARADRSLGASRRVPLVPRAGRGPGLRLGFLRAARALELPRRRAEARSGDRSRRSRVLDEPREGPPGGGPSQRVALAYCWFWVLAIAGSRSAAFGVPSPVTGSQPREASKPPSISTTSLLPVVMSCNGFCEPP